MTNNVEHVVVSAGVGAFDMWERVEVTAALNQATRTFRLETAEPEGAWHFPPGTPIVILANGSPVCTGFVNEYLPQGDARSHNPSVTGRGKVQDFVDSAAMYEPGYWEEKTPEDIAKDLDKFGAGISADVPLKPIPYYQLNQGETAWQATERALRGQGATVTETAEGQARITNASAAGRHAGGLIEGHNIREFSGKLSDTNRMSEYIVRGQNRHGHGDENLQIEETATDAGVQRYRPKVIVHEADTDKDRATDRGTHERDRRQGFSVRASITVQGWRDDGGLLWEPNNLVFVQSPSLKIAGDMLIEKVTFSQDAGGQGSISRLDLVNAIAYGGSGGESQQSDGAWQ